MLYLPILWSVLKWPLMTRLCGETPNGRLVTQMLVQEWANVDQESVAILHTFVVTGPISGYLCSPGFTGNTRRFDKIKAKLRAGHVCNAKHRFNIWHMITTL